MSNIVDNKGTLSKDLTLRKDSLDKNIGKQSINGRLLYIIPIIGRQLLNDFIGLAGIH